MIVFALLELQLILGQVIFKAFLYGKLKYYFVILSAICDYALTLYLAFYLIKVGIYTYFTYYNVFMIRKSNTVVLLYFNNNIIYYCFDTTHVVKAPLAHCTYNTGFMPSYRTYDFHG